MSGFDLSDEKFGKAAEVAPGVWTLSHSYYPGKIKLMGEINNRAFLFKVRDILRDIFVFSWGRLMMIGRFCLR
jgi:hypothetical protein